MTKTKISDVEKKSNQLPGVSDSFDLDILEKYLRGKSIDALANERYLSKGQVDMRMKLTMKAVNVFLDEVVPDKFYQDPLAYKDYWLKNIKQYNYIKVLRHPTSAFSVFVAYFKRCSPGEKGRMLTELEKYTYE